MSILSASSATMIRSRMIGAARRESSQVLCSTTVLVPPMKISEVYSSMARLLSPTYGTYLITTCTKKNWGILPRQREGVFILQYGLDALPLCKGPCWIPPCHQQHYSWRFLSTETVLEQTDSFHHCFQDGCSSQLIQAGMVNSYITTLN